MWAINRGQNIHCCIADDLKKSFAVHGGAWWETNYFSPKPLFRNDELPVGQNYSKVVGIWDAVN